MRIVVVGTSGSGKTTFARRLAERLGVPHIELDVLHWGPHWTARPPEVFRDSVSQATAASAWVCDGNYSTVRDVVWTRADRLIWLNYSFPVVFYRAVARTVARLMTREELFGGNRESLRFALDPDWIPWWVLRTYWRRRREYPALFETPAFEHLDVVQFRRSKEADAFLQDMGCHGR